MHSYNGALHYVSTPRTALQPSLRGRFTIYDLLCMGLCYGFTSSLYDQHSSHHAVPVRSVDHACMDLSSRTRRTYVDRTCVRIYRCTYLSDGCMMKAGCMYVVRQVPTYHTCVSTYKPIAPTIDRLQISQPICSWSMRVKTAMHASNDLQHPSIPHHGWILLNKPCVRNHAWSPS